MSKVDLTKCSRGADIADYLDGELMPASEAAFERHLRECPLCSAKLNEQKQLLRALDFAFESEKKFELPTNFAKTVAVRAEADISGLQSKDERRKAFLIIVGLFLLGAAVGFISKKSGVLPVIVEKTLTQTWIVGEVLARFCYDIGVGAIVILRAFGRQFIADTATSSVLLICTFFVTFLILSRLLLKFHRV